MKRAGMMRWVTVLSVVMAPFEVDADLIERRFREPDGDSVISAYVLQGSRDMKDLGERRSSRRGSADPSRSLKRRRPVTVLPELETEALRRKPRFGHGSDYRPDEEGNQVEREAIPTEHEATDADRRPDRSITPIRGVLRGRYHRAPFHGWGYPYAYGHFHSRPGCYRRYASPWSWITSIRTGDVWIRFRSGSLGFGW